MSGTRTQHLQVIAATLYLFGHRCPLAVIALKTTSCPTNNKWCHVDMSHENQRTFCRQENTTAKKMKPYMALRTYIKQMEITHMCKHLISAILFSYVVKAISFNPLLPDFLPTPRHYISMFKSVDTAESFAKGFKVNNLFILEAVKLGNEV